MTHLGELISAHLDGELDSREAARVAAHLDECPECRHELEAVASARALVRELPPPTLPEPLIPAGRGRRIAAVAASAAAVALAGALLVAPAESGPPFDLDALVEQHTARGIVDPGISTIGGPAGSP
jgi:anti-sigma factor RsiW